jgi:hypothetical protein
MLLVIIAALATALFVEHRRSGNLEQKLAAANVRLPHYATYRVKLRPSMVAGQPQTATPTPPKRTDAGRSPR